MKTIIIGGVAAGASAAARLRRLAEDMEIILLEKGKFISYANCGLPYHLGGVIKDKSSLLIMPPAQFAAWFNIDVRTENEVIKINREQKTLTIKNNEKIYEESYDKLVIATGATPIGGNNDVKRVFNLWTFHDMEQILAQLPAAEKAVVVGAGFIGLEAAENLRKLGLDLTIIQRGDHVLPTIDREMATPLAQELDRLQINCRFNCTVKNYLEKDNSVVIELDNGEKIETDLVINAIGVKPNSVLAKECGLTCGERGHIIVNSALQTSDENIYAAGDCVEVFEPIFGGRIAIPLAGPANKQGRIVADNIAGKNSVYRGSFGASVVKLGTLHAASVGFTESKLQDLNIPYKKLYLHPASHASYYPGAARLHLKLIFGDDGAIYGAQIVGGEGVDKRINSIAQAMRGNLKVSELGELELAYAPPFNSAKDPINFAGFVADNILSGLSDVVYPDSIDADAVVIDVREKAETELGAIENSINIPLGELRKNLDKLDKNKRIICCCQVGLRGYLAERILKQHGFKAANLSGGWLTWKLFYPEELKIMKTVTENNTAATDKKITVEANVEMLDVRALACPGPIIKLKAAMDKLADGATLHLLAPATFENDLVNWAKGRNFLISELKNENNQVEAFITKNPSEKTELTITKLNHEVSMVVFSNDLDKGLAAMILANGLAASGAKVSVFFTFWGLSLLRKNPALKVKKNLISRMFGFMLPKGAKKLALSKMNMLGLGTSMMKSVMKQKGVLSLDELMASARESGVKFIACDMAMDIMGISKDELIEVDEIAGVATFAELAKTSNNTLFI